MTETEQKIYCLEERMLAMRARLLYLADCVKNSYELPEATWIEANDRQFDVLGAFEPIRAAIV